MRWRSPTASHPLKSSAAAAWFLLATAFADMSRGAAGADGVAGRVDGVAGRADGVAGRVDGVTRRADGVAGRVDGVAKELGADRPSRRGVAAAGVVGGAADVCAACAAHLSCGVSLFLIGVPCSLLRTLSSLIISAYRLSASARFLAAIFFHIASFSSKLISSVTFNSVVASLAAFSAAALSASAISAFASSA
eukprot:CAMPEP_0174735070 /NCGR_PEP_ID=MMETSP1094-20130205/64322_1 /TAXON_ID=156173 /ORGANISM="Chrysochromulina brevifilum, Strain UTEX LB 985" /LENGTH=192 /DNA_ID=CAMNT_0015937985 /DNA_START=364 /DNA_END=940 /DNA_ORIENTATION=-